MATIQRFEDLSVWQEARVLTRTVYALTRRASFRQDQGLAVQSQRAAVSVMANVAEGFERKGNREFIAFLSIARASAGEVRSHLTVALDVGSVGPEDFSKVAEQTRIVMALIDGLIRYLKTVEHRGHRFKTAEPARPQTPNPKPHFRT